MKAMEKWQAFRNSPRYEDKKGAVVKNAIVMQDGYIMSNTELECCILDKGVIVREGTRLIAPATYPTVIGKNMII